MSRDQLRAARVRALQQWTARVVRRWSENWYADSRAAARFHSTFVGAHRSANGRAAAPRRARCRTSWSAPARAETRDAAAQKRAGVFRHALRERAAELVGRHGCAKRLRRVRRDP